MTTKTALVLCALLLAAGSAAAYLTLENKHNARMEITDLMIDDVNSDGRKEILASSYDSKVYLLDSSLKTIWKHDARSYVMAVNVIDRKRGGPKEILVGAGSLRILDQNGTVVDRISTVDPVKDIIVGDMNADGVDEIVVVAGSVRNNKILVFDSNLTLTQQTAVKGEFSGAMILLDVNADGKKELIVGTSEVYAYDQGLDILWTHEMANLVYALEAADVDCDKKMDILVGSKPSVEAIALDGTAKWEYKTEGTVRDIHVTDLEADGRKEVIAASDKTYLLDDAGKLLWAVNGSDDVYSVNSGDLNWDGIEEVAAASKKLQVIGKDGIVQWEYEPYRVATKILVEDLDSDGKKDLIASGADYTVYLFKAREVYVKEMQSYVLYNQACRLYDEGLYDAAAYKITEALAIKQQWNVGKCANDSAGCEELSRKIGEKTTSTSTTQAGATTSTTMETTTTTQPAEQPQDGGGIILPAAVVLVLLGIGAAYFLTGRK